MWFEIWIEFIYEEPNCVLNSSSEKIVYKSKSGLKLLHLFLNVDKIKELIVNFRKEKKKGRQRFPVLSPSQRNLSWTSHT